MMKKLLKNTNLLFVIMMSAVLLLHIYFLFCVPFSDDETHYATVPFRLINGDSLVQHEWHLTQFASLFSYLPVRIWMAIKGSADGIFVFLRCVYLTIHTSVAVLIYRFFKQYGKWAILASMMFYVQVTYRIQAISYQSMFAIFLLLLTLCLLSIYQNSSTRSYVFAGVCFGCCCVCNPLFCLVFALYLFICALWTKRQVIVENIIKNKTSRNQGKGKKLTKRQKREQKQQLTNAFPNMENYSCFFNKKAILWVTLGILIVAVIALVFFFSTGGTIDSIMNNIENLLGSSEYDIASKSVFFKLQQTIYYFSMANLGMPWILPLIFIVLLFDKNRTSNIHRFAYLTVLSLWTVMFIFGVMRNIEIYLCAISLPFSVISTTCYLLTENKNKTLFYCMYLPCLVATFFHYLAADTLLGAIGVVLAISNVAGVFFARDLWREMRFVSKDNSATTVNKESSPVFRSVIIVAFCLQILFYGVFYQYGQIYGKDTPKATYGPYSGLYMSAENYDRYNKTMSDLDYIKKYSSYSSPILVVSYSNWMYLHLDRPIATYTTWYRGTLDVDLLKTYYKENPKKTPKYVYYESSDPQNANISIVTELFEVSRENLSNGVLLTVEKCKF